VSAFTKLSWPLATRRPESPSTLSGLNTIGVQSWPSAVCRSCPATRWRMSRRAYKHGEGIRRRSAREDDRLYSPSTLSWSTEIPIEGPTALSGPCSLGSRVVPCSTIGETCRVPPSADQEAEHRPVCAAQSPRARGPAEVGRTGLRVVDRAPDVSAAGSGKSSEPVPAYSKSIICGVVHRPSPVSPEREDHRSPTGGGRPGAGHMVQRPWPLSSFRRSRVC
jgi:hypothetical protein